MHVRVTGIRQNEIFTAVPLVAEPSSFEVKTDNEKLKKV
jgi:hypothetical protein